MLAHADEDAVVDRLYLSGGRLILFLFLFFFLLGFFLLAVNRLIFRCLGLLICFGRVIVTATTSIVVDVQQLLVLEILGFELASFEVLKLLVLLKCFQLACAENGSH